MTRSPQFTVDVAAFAREGAELHVLVRRPAGASRGVELPWDLPAGPETLTAAARRIARAAAGAVPAWMVQVGAFADGRRHPSEAALSIAYAVVRPSTDGIPEGHEYVPLSRLSTLAPRQRAIVEAARASLCEHVSRAPVAFHLLPRTFTLGALQSTYELLLERPLHKASFRRALRAAELVSPVDEWHSEGRGRPAQLFVYAPSKRASGPRIARLALDGVA
jgi:8-oxo-dGTP diphosphatase